MTYAGGIRDRIILESLLAHVRNGLDSLGWFDGGRPHQPIQVLVEPFETSIEILPNVISICEEGVDEMEAEIGSILTEFRWQYAIDIYAENSAVGRQLWGDLKGLLQGRFSAFSSRPQVPIFDWAAATPTEIFTCQIENVVGGRQREYQKPFERYWWTILLEVVDVYGSDDDPV
jgi:hypothetical protein